MSNSSSSRPEGQGYKSDVSSSLSPQLSSYFEALVGGGVSSPSQATPLVSRPPSSSRRPQQTKTIRADLHRCGSELSEADLVDLRSRYDIPSLVMFLRPGATDREVLSLADVGPAQLTPNMRLSIVGFYSTCLLAGVTPTAEFFLTSFSQRTQKDDFLYFTVRPDMKGFCGAFASKVEPDIWRPFFFYVVGDGLP
ncbi:hypothetical protein LIER_21678 [Lithospermum erythrorhizon]|uniref:TLDc domain-containing protein n=1 Tax=Lithospermum erythrorhizon TaxID=34254 RepID=A0AAV3QU84_LITER